MSSYDNRGQIFDISLQKNSHWNDSIFVLDENEVAVDITGATVQMKLYDSESKANLLDTWSAALGDFTITGVEGKITASKYVDTAFCRYYELDVVYPTMIVDGQALVDPLLRGKIHVK